MPRIALTAGLVASLEPAAKVVEYRDIERRGLMLRIYPSGERSYFLWYQSTRGRSERVPLGHAGSLTLPQARKIVGDRLAALRAEDGTLPPPTGTNVVLESGPVGVTVQTLVEAYIADTPLAPDTQIQYRNLLKAKVIPHVGPRLAEEVSRLEWVEWGRTIRDLHGGVTANRCHQMVRAAINFGTRIGLIRSCAATWDRLPMPFHETPRTALFPPEFMRAAWTALGAFDHSRRWQPDAARLIMLTWCRVRQIVGLTRPEVQGLGTPDARLVIDPSRPGSKRRHGRSRRSAPAPHIVPVTARMGRILQRRMILTELDPLFPGQWSDTPGSSTAFALWQHEWAQATACVLVAGPPPADRAARGRWLQSAPKPAPWRVHDIRASALTHSLELLDADISLAPLMLGHVSGQPTLAAATRIYDRSLMLGQRRALLERWGEWLANEAT